GDMRGYNVGNAAADIDPNNIASITVLKGPNAAALYGSAAANGAIVISTKKGRGPEGEAGFGLTATIGSQMETPLMLPAYQNQYGQGAYGEFNFVDGNGGGTYDFYDESWGPMLDGRTTGCVFQRDAAGNTINDSNGHPLYDQSQACNQFNGPGPWIAHPNNVRDFFRTGMLNTVNVAVSRSAERSNVRLSVGRTDESGMYPNNRNLRTDINLSGGAQVSDRLSTEAAIDYINDGINGAPKQSYDEGDPMQTFIWFGRQVDVAYMKNHMFRDPNDPLTQQIIAGNSWLNTSAPIPYSWNYSYHDNPYWQASMRQQNFSRNRLLGHASATYKFNDWLNVTGRVGRDWYSNHLRANYPVNTVDGSYRLGAFDVVGETRNQTTYDVLFNGERPLLSDLNLTVSAGGSIWKRDYNSGHNDVTQLVIPGVYTMENSAGQPTATVYLSRKQVNSLYASASFNYKRWFNVDVTGRNDWSSTLPKNHYSYFYPSVGAAFIFTDALGIQNDILSYGKLRASWTRVGNDTDPYNLQAVYGAGTPWAGQPTFTAPNTLPNVNLKPEQTTGEEVGTDLGFLNNGLILNVTWYQKTTKDQILPVDIPNATGYNRAYVNSGEVRNRGIEIEANFTPIQTGNFRWNVVANWAKNNSKVLSLYQGVDRVVVGSFWRVDVTADSGKAYGTLVGRKWARDDQGHILVNAAGLPVADPNPVVLGNYNPDWVGGITNTFTYKNLSFSFLLDGQYGGNVFSVTKWFGNYAGILKGTLAGREIDWDNPGYVVPNAVYEPGTTLGGVSVAGQTDTTHVLAQDYYENTFYAQETGMVDATYLKLRDARLAYNLPDRWVQRLGFSSATFALVGHNLLLWSKQDIIDPETAFDAANRQGVENGQLPTARTIGFTFTIRP
ncbi:MAG: SusC/RagA family TonB-linked outer membrane protein, partial [Gemmatimonadota bacterium]